VGIFVPPRTVLKVVAALIATALIGLIISAFFSQTLVWFFGVSALAVWFAAIPAVLSGVLTSRIKRTLKDRVSK